MIPRCCLACYRAPSWARKCSHSMLRTLQTSFTDTTFIIISSRTICKVIAAIYRRTPPPSLLSSQAVQRTFVTGAKRNVCSSMPVRQELLWFGIEPSDVVRNLRVWIDTNLSMRDHVSRVARTMLFSFASPVQSPSSTRPRCNSQTSFITSAVKTGLL